MYSSDYFFSVTSIIKRCDEAIGTWKFWFPFTVLNVLLSLTRTFLWAGMYSSCTNSHFTAAPCKEVLSFSLHISSVQLPMNNDASPLIIFYLLYRVQHLNAPWQQNMQHSESSHFHEAFEDVKLVLNLNLTLSPTEHKSLYLTPISVLNTADKSTSSLWSPLTLTCFICNPGPQGTSCVCMCVYGGSASMLGTYGLDTCRALSSALTSDSSHWAKRRFCLELLMTPSFHNSTVLISAANI